MPGEAKRGAIRAGVLLALGAALYGNSLGNDFVWDDRLGPATVAQPLPAVVGRSGAYHRPIVMLSLAVERALWDGAPSGFHATNVLCHLAVAWLLGALVEALGGSPGVALASAVLFAAHPVQTEAVTYISGRTDVLCALFLLAALLAWRRARHATDRFAVASAAAILAALLCKEAAVLLPLVLLVPAAHPAARPPRPALPLTVAALWLAGWAAGGGPGLRPGALAARLPAMAIAALIYLRLVVWPADLHLERFTPVGGWSAGAVGAWAMLAAVAAGLLALARRVPGGYAFLALAVLGYLPVSGIVPVYPAIADRALFTPEHFLYLPLLGLVPLLTAGAAAAWPPRAVRAAPAVVGALVLVWGAVVIDRNRDWRDEETLFRHTTAYDPPAARVWFNLGNLALAAGRLGEAERLYRAALAREPGDGDAHLNLGITLQRAHRLADAEEQYRRAIAADPRLTEAYRALAALLVARGATAEAAEVWQAGQARRP